MKPKQPPRLLVALSDIHAGSTVGLLPPGFVTKNGQGVTQNGLQKWLWQCWQDGSRYVDHVVGQDPFALILNGDMIEGNHHRTLEIISPDTSDHAAAAAIILEPLCERASKRFMVRGTECHVGTSEDALGALLGCEIMDPVTKRRAADELFIEMNGLTINARHHCSTTSRTWLESGEFSRMLQNERLEAMRNGERPADIVLRAHRHRYGCWDEGHGLAVVTPAWQALTRHGHKVVPSARCNPGVFILDWRGKSLREMPQVHRRIYRAPAPPPIPV